MTLALLRLLVVRLYFALHDGVATFPVSVREPFEVPLPCETSDYFRPTTAVTKSTELALANTTIL